MNLFKSVTLLLTRTSSVTPCVTPKRFFTDTPRPFALKPKKPKSKNEDTARIFVDNCAVEAIGGRGGDGCISFLQIWSNDKAGPDGGDGGNGGHVIFKAGLNVQNLSHVAPVVRAPHGERGFNKDCNGKNAKHEFVPVPVGTIIRNKQGVIVGDLSEEGAMFVAARGGAGGHGNHFFASDTMQAPQVAEFGADGETCKYVLEVKSMANFGMVGMPNAGKSTLLRAISRARPEVAAYAFTTLRPHIGIVQYSDYEQIAVADLPGLVEGSHKNEGLGIQFLKHAERCSGLLFVIDLSADDPVQQYEVLRYEVSMFSQKLCQRPHIVIANKLDLEKAQENLPVFKSKISDPVFAISAKTGKNLVGLLDHMRRIYDEHFLRQTP